MATRLVIEEFHVTVFVPRDLPAGECRAIRRMVAGTGFRTRLQHAVDGVARSYPALVKATAVVSR